MSGPTLRLLTVAGATALAVGSGVTASAAAVAPAADPDTACKGSVTGAYVLGAAGLVGLVLGLSARQRRATVEEPDRATVPTGAK